MSSFNVFGSRSLEVGANLPIWLGTVSPAPIGGVLDSDFAAAGIFIPAGAPLYYNASTRVATPFACFVVSDVDSTTHTLTVSACGYYAPAANDVLSVVGSTFATTGAAGKISAVTDNGDGTLDITFTTSALDSLSEGAVIAPSAATAAAASGASLAVKPNCYLYNDIYFGEESLDNASASCAVVFFHGEGILIDRTPSAAVASQMLAAVPGVYQVAE